jgi:plastocyanin
MDQVPSNESQVGERVSKLPQLLSMPRVRYIPVLLGVGVLLATVALQLGAARSDAAVSPTMHAAVHANNDITLTFDDGSAVGNQDRVSPTVPAGTYTVRVVDDTEEHNFHLVGPGVDQSTDTGGRSSPSWTVALQAGGSYRFVCDTHVDFMYGQFQAVAGAGGSTGGSTGGSSGGSTSGGGSSGGGSSGGSSGGSTSSGGSASTALKGTLAGTVKADGALRLAYLGKPVTRLKSGRYKITVVDKTAGRGFVVKATGRPAVTVSTAPFVGTRSVTVDLKAGRWSFYTPAGKKSTTSFIVVA